MSSFNYIMGQWNVVCSMCGRDRKSGEMVKNWQGQWRCPEHNEPRHPQDYVRAPGPESQPEFVQNPADIDIESCDVAEISALAGIGRAGCAIAGYVHPGAYELNAEREALANGAINIVLS